MNRTVSEIVVTVGRNADSPLSAFIAGAPFAMAMFDREMRFIAVSERWLGDYGLVASPVGRRLDEVLPEIPEAWKAVYRRCLEGASDRSESEIFRRADGHAAWVKWSAWPWRDSDGAIGGLVLTSEDITARKGEEAEAERSLRASEERFRTLVEEAPDAILLYDVDKGRLIDANKAAERLFGASRDKLFTSDPRRFYAPEQPDGRPTSESFGENNARALAGEQVTFERLIRRPSGEDRLCRVTLVRLSSSPRLLRSSLVDITEQRAEEAHKGARDKADAILSSIADGFIALDANWRYVYFNDRAERLLRRRREDVMGRVIFDVFPQLLHSPIDARYRRAMNERVPIDFEEFSPVLLRWMFYSIYPTSQGGITVYFRDVSERKHIERTIADAKLEAERANEAKSKFLAAASHDLRQPVQSLVLLMALAERQIAGNPPALDTLAKMRGSLDGLNRLLSAILDLSRLDSGVEVRSEVVDLAVLFSRLALEFGPKAEERGLVFRMVARKLLVIADSALLERALRNLIENALRYTPEGGVLVGLRRRGDGVRIDVVDTGIGVPEDRRTDIFGEFTQLNNPGRQLGLGLGLGLAIVDRIARLMGATIEVRSREGKGSRFSLTLPLANATPAGGRAVPAEAVRDPGGRILIVENDLSVRESLETLLREWGYETVAASGGEQALDAAARDGWRFGGILTDHRLGVGLTGVETVREILRRSGRAVPALVLTGDTARETIADIAASGFEVVHKPISAERLRAALARLMGA